MKDFWILFSSFFRIGAFTFGGGYAMLPLIEQEIVDKRKWIERPDFMDLFAVAQSLPGVFAVNMAIFVGYKIRKTCGGIISALGTILPSFLIILLIAIFFSRFRNNPDVLRIFYGIRPVIVALIAAPVLRTWRAMSLGNASLWMPALSALLVWYFGVSPIWIIIAAALGGILYVRYIRCRINPQGTNLH